MSNGSLLASDKTVVSKCTNVKQILFLIYLNDFLDGLSRMLNSLLMIHHCFCSEAYVELYWISTAELFYEDC